MERMMELRAKPYGDLARAKVLVIGHDPLLQNSNTICEHAFFADYYFKTAPKSPSERRKYDLAKNLYSHICDLTSCKFSAEEVYITNLCNRVLKRRVPGKTVLIPEEDAKAGLQDIRGFVKSSDLKIIFAMSQQVNYWLQKFGFYWSSEEYLADSQPKSRAAENGFYEPVGKSPFLKICGKEFKADGIPLYPILHIKQIPLRGAIKSNYEGLYADCINSIMMRLNSE